MTIGLFAQNFCGTDRYYRQRLKEDPSIADSAVALQKRVEQYLKDNARTLNGPSVTDTISVVFHVLYVNEDEKIPEKYFDYQIARLNEDYNSENSDLYKVPVGFKPVIGNMKIKFMLAHTDPDGNETTGIDYKQTSVTTFNNQSENMKFDELGGTSSWPYDQYLNVWICHFSDNNLPGILGYATFASDNSPARDGIVMQPFCLGIKPNNFPEYNYGRVLVHEAGHWLGLKHIWGDDQSETNKCSGSDDVADTPNQDTATYGLRTPGYKRTSCSNGVNGNMWMNYMDYTSDFSKYMFTQDQVNKAKATLDEAPIRLSNTQSRKYLPPVYNMTSTPIFTTNNFSSIGVGKYGVVWAGTNLQGLYKLNKVWQKAPVLGNRTIQQIATDKDSGVWIAQSGYEAAKATGGGADYFADSTFASHIFYSKSKGLSARNVFGIYVDTASSAALPQVWVCSYPQLETELNQNGDPFIVPREGGAYQGLITRAATPSPYFDTVSIGSNHFYSAIGGNEQEVWTIDDDVDPDSFFTCQVARYDRATKAEIQPFFTYNNTGGIFPETNIASAIYFDRNNNKWIGLKDGGIAYADNTNQWKPIFFPEIFPDGSSVNDNAITGDDNNFTYIGTTQGLVVCDGINVDDIASYTLFTTANGLPSNNITALAVDRLRKKLVIATDKGITIWNTDCLLRNCTPARPLLISTVKNGNWDDPTVWSTGTVPQCGDLVVITNEIEISTHDAVCASLLLARETKTNIKNAKKVVITSGFGCQ